jgi:hypothetical protein
VTETPGGPPEHDGEQDPEHELADQALFERLRAVVDADPVPAAVVTDARAAFALRRFRADLAELAFDSAMETTQLAGLRSRGNAKRQRQLTFVAPSVRVEVEVDERLRRLVGRLVPGEPAEIELRHRDGALHTETDQAGRFVLDGIPIGPASITVSWPSGTRTATEWLPL